MDNMLKGGNGGQGGESNDVPSAPPVPANLAVGKLPANRTTINVRVAEPAPPAETPKITTAADLNLRMQPAPSAPVAAPQDIQEPADIDASADVEPDYTTPDNAAPGGDIIAPEEEKPAAETPKKTRRNPFSAYWRHKLWTVPLTVLVLAGAVAAVPQSRYPLLALVMSRQFAVTVVDSNTNKPVSGASVSMDGASATTDTNGKATLSARVGKRTLTVTKKYYQNANQSVFVGIGTGHNTASVRLVATGRQVPIKVVDKITGQAVANAAVRTADTEAITDDTGMVNMVLPTSSPTLAVTVSADGYTKLTATIQVTSDTVPANTFGLVPSGRVYFLSNLSGKIDVVSTNLDGSDRKTILAGTGSEDANNTVLLASRDWQFLALLSKRDGGNHAKLFLITTSSGQVATMDGSAASFTLVGWSNHYFVYEAQNDGVSAWQAGQTTIRSYNADTMKGITVDQTNAQGAAGNYIYQNISFVNLVSDRVVYGLAWSAYYANTAMNVGGQNNSVMSAGVDGSNKKDVRDITLPAGATYTSLASVPNRPGTLYIQSTVQSQPAVYYSYQYQNNSVSQSSTITDSSYNQAQQNVATYLLSPTGKSTFWSQVRDGKNTLFTGDADGNNANQIASLSDYAPYGWYTDKYLLVQKGGSELYAMPVGGGTPVKISDYYKPSYSFYGYGGGYGGL